MIFIKISYLQLRTLLMIAMAVAFISCNRKTEVVQNYGTGEISRKFITIDGKKEGLMTDYYPDGSLKGERFFENDIQVGKTTIYYQSGKIKEVQYYVDGIVHGGDTIFYENGSPEFVVTFDRGIKHGYLRKWSLEGELTYEAKYQNDILVEVKGEVIKPDTTRKVPTF